MARTSAHQHHMAKTTSYSNDGYGRDSYIYNINGGFSPEKLPTKIHATGKFQNLLTNLTQIFRFVCDTKIISSASRTANSFKTCCLYEQRRWQGHLYISKRWRVSAYASIKSRQNYLFQPIEKLSTN